MNNTKEQRAMRLIFPLFTLFVAGSLAACSSSSSSDTSSSGQDASDTGVSTPADSGVHPDAATSHDGGGADAVGGADAAVNADATAADSSAADSGQPPADSGSDVNATILIADQFNNRVIEITRTGSVVWFFGTGSSTAGADAVVAPNDAERIPGNMTLISGTGAPQNTEPTCMGANGCPDNRVIIVNHGGQIIWQYDQLNTPVCSVMLANGNVLITDQGNQRVIEVTTQRTIAWQYGTTSSAAVTANHLSNPNSAERLANGNTLIADENNNRVIEVTMQGAIVWQYPMQLGDLTMLNGAAFASRLASGNTLISDSNNNRIIEVNPQGTIVWMYATNTRAMSNAMPLPTRGVRLANGHTLISDQFNHQVIEVDNAGTIVFSYGQINMAGNGPGQLNGPYDAKVIGDFTGLTPPF
jgi:hypothetical protein